VVHPLTAGRVSPGAARGPRCDTAHVQPVVAVVGPTATGKSDLAVELALRLDGEVVSADAMQLYRGMDIGTAKLSLDERREVPHHQLDVLEVTQEASLAAYQRAARSDIDAVRRQGRVAILAGGSGLYVRAALDALEIPPTDPLVRAELDERLANEGTTALYGELSRVDPAAAQTILPSNGRRIVRALEVVALTGRPFQAGLPEPEYAQPTVQIGLRLERVHLDRRTDQRVDRMWQQGFVAEVESLVARGIRQGRTAARAVGYAQVLAALEQHLSLDEARVETAQATRRLIRRQESWFRRDGRIVWLPADAPDLVERALHVLREQPGPAAGG
jgi:tRNA dimethylallyltransferase